MNNAILQINATFGKRAADEETGDLEAKVKASMRAVIAENWMDTTDDGVFRAGVGGALLSVGLDSDDGKRLQRSIEALRKFSAFLTAAQAGLSVDPSSLEEPEGAEPLLPLMNWWHEVKAKQPSTTT